MLFKKPTTPLFMKYCHLKNIFHALLSRLDFIINFNITY